MRLDHLLSREKASRGSFTVGLSSLRLGKPRGKVTEKKLVAMRLWGTPVPIPNTMVKTQAAEDTVLETAWESRWLPAYVLK